MTSDREAQAADLFARHRAEPTVRATIANLHTIREREVPHCLHGLDDDGPAVVVGAGPTLADSLPWLAEQAERGALIVAVNAAARAVEAAGIRLDVVVTREAVDVRDHFAPSARMYACDVTTHPVAFSRAVEMGRVAWFCAVSTQHAGMLFELGLRGVFGGPSALTAAVGLCERWGRSSIALVGAPLAFIDGRAYGPECAWGEVVGDMRGDHVALGGLDAMNDAHRSIGAADVPAYQSITMVPGVDGAEVPALWTWEDQRQWLIAFAARTLAWTQRAPGPGAHIPGWTPAADMPHAFGGPDLSPTWQVDVSPVLERVLGDAAHEAHVAASLQSGAPPPARATLGLLEAMSCGAMLDIRRRYHTMRRQTEAGYAARLNSARWVAELAADRETRPE